MDLLQFIQRNITLLDGGTGTLLQKAGLPLGELPERWNLTHAEILQDIHRAYFDAGSHIVCTNTFGANSVKFSDGELEKIVKAGVENARIAKETSVGKQEKFIALDIGPLGKLLKPYGDFEFERAVEVFAKTVRLGVKEGVDLIFIETMGDSLECKAAVLAAKENANLPVFVSCAYGEDKKLLTGASPAAMVAMLEGLGVDGIGVNCSVSPAQVGEVVEELLARSSLPVLVKPNAGLPVIVDGKTEYDIKEEGFAGYIENFVKRGARLVGGCCGTTPAYIRAVADKIKALSPVPIKKKNFTCVSSYTRAVTFDLPILIGERINPTGKKRFRQALAEGDIGYILQEGLTQQENGAHILDVNVGTPEVDEKVELPKYIQELQAVLDLPLQLDSADPVALERGMRVYNGKPLVNSVNGKKESMDAVFPLVKKYGGVVIGLTLDEKGIPDSAEERVEIALRILEEGKKYGIEQKDIVIDPLAMTISTDAQAAEKTLRAIELLTEKGIKTSLGVSNISFGLPSREVINSVFFALALQKGLSAAILNPNSADTLKAYYAYLALSGKDESCQKYIEFIGRLNAATPVATVGVSARETTLKGAIVRGLKEEAGRACSALLEGKEALEIIEKEIVPALDEMGKAYEEKRAYLPQLLMSAEAAKGAFEKIKEKLLSGGQKQKTKGRAVFATVKGDIHDIGKNIVATLLENYGFEVVDLGKDVPKEKVLEGAKGADFVGLSALMTTTLPSMAETVALIKEHIPAMPIVVGGAVLTQEYADGLGVAYSKDALATVRFAEKVCKK